MGSPVGSPLGCNTKGASRWRSWRGLGAKRTETTQIQEERGEPELPPPKAETRLPSGKVTATKSFPSCAGTDPFKGLNGRQQQLGTRGERQGSPPRESERTEGDLLARSRVAVLGDETVLVALRRVKPPSSSSETVCRWHFAVGALAELNRA